MNITSLDLLLLGAVPSVVAVLGTVLWRIAVHRVSRASGASAVREGRPAPAAPVHQLAHAGGDPGPVSRHSGRAGR